MTPRQSRVSARIASVVAVVATGVLGAPATARADSYVTLRNDTRDRVTVRWTATPTGLDASRWGRPGEATSIAPGATARIAWFNRHVGITPGATFVFGQRIEVEGAAEGFPLRQRLEGSIIGSDLAQSLGDHDAWFDDGHAHLARWEAGGRAFVVAGQVAERDSVFEVGDDIVYSIEEQTLASDDPRDPDELHVLTYNIWNVPLLSEQAEARAAALPAYLAPYDVVVLSEAFDEAILERLWDRLRRMGFTHRTQVTYRPPAPVSSGVVILSRWPLEDAEAEHFDPVFPDPEYLSSKGFVYAKLRKGEGAASRVYHVVGTHTQSDTLGERSAVRARQFERIRAFIDARAIPPAEPVIVAGDLNVDRHGLDYGVLELTLGARWPERDADGEEAGVHGHPFTFDTEDNPHAKAAVDMAKDTIIPIVLPKLGTEQVFLDYVLCDDVADRIQPSAARVETRKCWPGATPLSDHYAVYAKLRFDR